MRMPTDQGTAPAKDRPEPNITLWGAPSSGKTAFISALHGAVTKAASEWRLVAVDGAAVTTLDKMSEEFMEGRRFPQATQALDEFRMVLIGDERPRRLHRPGSWSVRRRQAPRVNLHVLDPPGEAFNRSNSQYSTFRKQLGEQLERSQGLVYLYDPIQDYKQGDAYRYFFSSLTELAQRVLGGDGARKGRLPHHVAVCITKFDDPRVLETAERQEYLTYDDNGFPRVEPDEARELFETLCANSRHGNADMVLKSLDSFFIRGRVRFFATSAVGFYAKHGHFDRGDYQNVVDQVGGQTPRIRGRVHPVNVWEPVEWLGEMISNGHHG